MRVDDRMRKCVVSVGDANDKAFVPHGTGFVTLTFLENEGFQQLVTAKHVVDEIKAAAPNGNEIHVRLNDHTGAARVISTHRDDWKAHPDPAVDIAVCPTHIPVDQYDILHLSLEDKMILRDFAAADADVGLGDEVIIAGMFMRYPGEAKHSPIIRTGTIAALPAEKIETSYGFHYAYFIEARSIDGLSGSPVFAVTSMMQLSEGKITFAETVKFQLIGVLLGHNRMVSQREVFEIKRAGEEIDVEQQERMAVYVNTGIGLVIPMSYVFEVVEMQELKDLRQATLEGKRQATGYVADSAARQELPTKPENPQHREDFNRLLDAAASKNKRGRGT